MADLTTLNDQELVNLLKQDKLGAFREVYNRYWKQLYADAFKRLGSRESAEEIVQELFTMLWQKRASLGIGHNLAGYLHTSARNLIIDHYRKELVRERYKESVKLVYDAAAASAEDALLVKELQYSIEQGVRTLPDKCRSVYELSRLEHKSNKEIATTLGISEKTVENHITKALKHIRLELASYLSMLALLLFK